MYAWIWHHLPGNGGVKAVCSVLLILAVVAVLWFWIFPLAEPLLPFDDVQVTAGWAGRIPVDQPGPKRGTQMPVLVLDNYDSFTYNLVQYLGQLGVESEVWRNDEISLAEIARLDPAGVLLSPGPGTPDRAGIM